MRRRVVVAAACSLVAISLTGCAEDTMLGEQVSQHQEKRRATSGQNALEDVVSACDEFGNRIYTTVDVNYSQAIYVVPADPSCVDEVR